MLMQLGRIQNQAESLRNGESTIKPRLTSASIKEITPPKKHYFITSFLA
jgi:hypothetical protein